jgi:predicted DNA-binding transcriptional regulator AlpA
VEAQDPMLKKPEVAKRYGCSVRTVIRMEKRGEGPKPVRIGPRMIRYRKSDVERYLGTFGNTEEC